MRSSLKESWLQHQSDLDDMMSLATNLSLDTSKASILLPSLQRLIFFWCLSTWSRQAVSRDFLDQSILVFFWCFFQVQRISLDAWQGDRSFGLLCQTVAARRDLQVAADWTIEDRVRPPYIHLVHIVAVDSETKGLDLTILVDCLACLLWSIEAASLRVVLDKAARNRKKIMSGIVRPDCSAKQYV